MSTPLPRGLLIAFEGIDGAGKTTQLRRVADAFERAGLVVLQTKEPTDGPHGARIRRSATEGRLPVAEELEAFLADRAEHVAARIRPALAAGQVVLVDRYYLSSVAYQGARGLEPAEVLRLNEVFAPAPDLVILLDVPAAVGLARVRSRDAQENLFEREDELVRAREIFTGLEGQNIVRLDGQLEAPELTARILDALVYGPLLRVLPGDEPAVGQQANRSNDPRWLALARSLLPMRPGALEEIERLTADAALSPEEGFRRLHELLSAR